MIEAVTDKPAITPAQQLLLDHRQRSAKALDDARAAQLGRLTNRLTDRRKQRFIDAFVGDSAIDGYPVDAADVLAANESDQGIHTGQPLRALTAREVHVVFQRYGFSGASQEMVATELLASDIGDQLLCLAQIEPKDVSLPLILAHLESLAFGLPPAVAIGVARRVHLLLLNRRLIQAEQEQS